MLLESLIFGNSVANKTIRTASTNVIMVPIGK